MRRKYGNTIKGRITIVTMSFTLFITCSLAFVSFFFAQSIARRSLIQSTEFNLQLVAGTIGQDIYDLDTLSRWCTLNDSVTSWLSDEDSDGGSSVRLFDRIQEEFRNNRANQYIDRLIVIDASFSKMIQVGNSLTGRTPINVYNADQYFKFTKDSGRNWKSVEQDPLTMGNQIIPVMRPIHQLRTGRLVGYLYMSINTDLVTDPLKNYNLKNGSRLYLTMGDRTYQISDSGFIPDAGRPLKAPATSDVTLNRRTSVTSEGDGEEKTIFVSFPANDSGIYLSQGLPAEVVSQQRYLYLPVLLIISLGVLILGLLITLFLNRTINTPVFRIRAKVDAIAKGDFSPAPEIEWDNELGDIGRGINQLSTDVVALMESQLAAEKKKRDLEYEMLQSQINPHFIYNTLNSIKWMATIQGASGIAEITTSFSRLLKNISKGTQKIIPLREELSLLDDYFVIQQYRYGGAISLKKEIDERALDSAIPRFTLQPLLENAIFHGIEPNGGAGTVLVRVRLSDDGELVEAAVEDDGIGMSAEAIEKIFSEENASADGLFKQIGILNVHRRIQYEFGEKYGLTIKSEPGSFTRAVILLPFKPC